MKVERIVYIANARLPTEKAHGYQICKMCEAFAQNGIDVTLLHPHRYQADHAVQGRNVFDYYGIRPVFHVRTLPNLDVVRMERFFPTGTFMAAFFTHALLWGLYASLVARKEKAHLYYTRDSGVAYWLLRLRLPTIHEAHAVPKRMRRTLLYRMAQHSALRLEVALTPFIKERFVGMGFPAEKVVVLPDSVDFSLFADLPSREECRRRLGLPQHQPVIGYVGRFQTLGMEKGIVELVQAMAHVPSVDGREPLLLCVGGPMEAVPAYLDLARRYAVPESRLQFVDRVPNREIPVWIRAFDISVAPFPNSEHYAYFMSPLKVFEYMAVGGPILATDLPSIREVLQHGKTAWLVMPGDPKGLAEGISRLLRDQPLSREIASRARQMAAKNTWEIRASTILSYL
jgi:glycosyltransferase involved in cell wall biosynthesis